MAKVRLEIRRDPSAFAYEISDSKGSIPFRTNGWCLSRTASSHTSWEFLEPDVCDHLDDETFRLTNGWCLSRTASSHTSWEFLEPDVCDHLDDETFRLVPTLSLKSNAERNGAELVLTLWASFTNVG
ncbi:PREDICTED: uncharacterized protein LOC105565337 [Vollenhovia emeryi]|uniref:uncharacterized protein LOC105565337 n=1 Tax=Vollenhovia emeryi TaxID=411798 RepID=UPI0005F4B346|nr:PREDICTED: uncharacterized protein LOC105565337 [Vollenhovia emeryi]